MKADSDKLHEACGVFGLEDSQKQAAFFASMGLFSLQHRGQEAAGIAAVLGEEMRLHKAEGLVPEVLNPEDLKAWEAQTAIGHVRYSTTGGGGVLNAQPLVVSSRQGKVAVAHNGNLVNAGDLRRQLESEGAVFQTSTDSEVILNLLARHPEADLVGALVASLQRLEGAYALTILSPRGLFGARDPYGLRPLSLGRRENGDYVLASETCALDVVGARLLRDVQPGELVHIHRGQLTSHQVCPARRRALCAFEFIYFARPDSVIDGLQVHQARNQAGVLLARECPARADLVIAVPDSGTSAAIGYAHELGVEFDEGLIKNHYVGRTFIRPDQEDRERSVWLKLNPIQSVVDGKRVVVVDDSIVRGTTSHHIVGMLRRAGAREVHIRVSSPPVVAPCFFGIDTPTYEELVGARTGPRALGASIAADSLGYLSLEGLMNSVGWGEDDLCLSCFTGRYPMPVPPGCPAPGSAQGSAGSQTEGGRT